MNERELRILVDAGVVATVEVSNSRHSGVSRYTVHVDGQPLQASGPEPRVFTSMDSVTAFLSGLGIRRFGVHLQYEECRVEEIPECARCMAGGAANPVTCSPLIDGES
ncbi:MAG: hypothetical protein HYU77_14940 [Betaproteobacteria bacterium]|nr:hypothetical protein [Betaproteobacteria bacterium]